MGFSEPARETFYVQHLLRGKHKKWNDLRSKFSFNLFECAVSHGASVQQHGHLRLRWQRCSFQTCQRGTTDCRSPQSFINCSVELPLLRVCHHWCILSDAERTRLNWGANISARSRTQTKSAASIFSHWYPSLTQWNHSSVRGGAATMGTTNRVKALPVRGVTVRPSWANSKLMYS